MSLHLGRPHSPIKLADALAPLAAPPANDVEVRAGFAYVTVGGLSRLLKTTAGQDWIAAKASKWVVGIDGGITEPAALDMLRHLPNAATRVFLPQGEMTTKALFQLPKFHAKVLRVQSASQDGIWVGSANATAGALGLHCTNYEVGMTAFGPSFEAGDRTRFDDWWDTSWNFSKPLTAALLDKYTEARKAALTKNPVLLQTMEPASIEALGKATVLWMDVGSASGGSRNQVEFNGTLASYFDNPTQQQKLLEIVVAGATYHDRPLSHKQTTFGVHIWRLSLPPQLAYPGRRIRLERQTSPAGNRFRLEIAAVNSARAKKWFAEANEKGHVESTHGVSTTKPGRQYGYY